MSFRPGRRKLAVFIVIASVVLLLAVAPVSAHAFLSSSDPSNGAQIDTAPNEIELQYSGDGVQVADVAIIGPDGEDISGEAQIDPDDAQIVRVPVADAGQGMYIVSWRVLADDGHTTRGTFFFSVGDDPIDRDAVIAIHEGDVDEGFAPVEAGSKFILVSGAVGLLGVPLTALLVIFPVIGRNSDLKQHTDRRIERMSLVFAVTLVGGVAVLGLTRAVDIGGFSTGALLTFAQSPMGLIWLGQLLLASLILIGLFLDRRSGGISRRGLIVEMIGAVLVIASLGWTSHSASLVARASGTVIHSGHILGAGLWVGGLIAVALVLPAVRGNTSNADSAMVVSAMVRRYSVLAIAGVTISIATGLVLASWHVPSLSALLESVYGRTLIAKSGVILLALTLGGVTRFVLLPRLGYVPDEWITSVVRRVVQRSKARSDGGTNGSDTLGRIRGSMRIEIGVLLVVIVLSALMTSAPTAGLVAGEGDLTSATIERTHDGGEIALSVLPGETVNNWIHTQEAEPLVVDVSYLSNDQPVDSERPVRLLATHSTGEPTLQIEMERIAEGTYSSVQAFPEPGVWEVRVTGSPDGNFHSEWYDVFVAPAPEEDDDHDHGAERGEGLTLPLVLLASGFVVSVVGSVVTVKQARQIDWFHHER